VTAEIPNFWTPISFAGISSNSRTGAGAMQCLNQGVARSMGALLLDVIVGFAYQSNSNSAPIVLFTQGIGGQGQCQLTLLPDGTLAIQPAGSVTVLASTNPSGPLITPGIYHYVEWQTGFSGTSLNQIWIDGQLVLSAFLLTQAAPLPGADTINLLGPGGGFSNFFDDYYLVNPDDGANLTTAAGDSSVICSISSANGDTNTWSPTPVTNQNWQNVHQIPSTNGTLYNRSGGISTIDDYEVLPQLLTTDEILAIQLMHMTFAEEGGDLAEPYLDIQGAPYSDSGHLYEPNTGQYTPTFFIYERNPVGTGLKLWTGTIFNGTNWGIKQIGHPVQFARHLYAVHNQNHGNVAEDLIT
jgi:hypothetical protein